MDSKTIDAIFLNYLKYDGTRQGEIEFTKLYNCLSAYILGFLKNKREYYFNDDNYVEFMDIYNDTLMTLYLNKDRINLNISSITTYTTTIFINKLKNIKNKRSNVMEKRMSLIFV